MLCTSASRPVRTCEPGIGCQCPNDRNPMRLSMHGGAILCPAVFPERRQRRGVTVALRAEALPPPTALTAVTVKAYLVPGTRPPTVTLRALGPTDTVLTRVVPR